MYMVIAGEECFEEHLTKRGYHNCSKSGGWVELSRTSCTNETEDEWIEHNDKKKTQLLTQEAKRAEAWGRNRWPGEREDCRWWYSVVLWNIWISFILGDNTHNYCAFRGVFWILEKDTNSNLNFYIPAAVKDSTLHHIQNCHHVYHHICTRHHLDNQHIKVFDVRLQLQVIEQPKSGPFINIRNILNIWRWYCNQLEFLNNWI